MKNQQTINPADYDTKGPGKFEGEPPATKYYYEQWLNGDGDAIFTESGEDETEGTLYHITSDEADAFNLPIGNYFLLWEDSQGFAYGEVYASRTAAEKAFNSKI